MNNLMRKLAGFKITEEDRIREEKLKQVKKKENISSQIGSGFILFGLIILFSIPWSILRAIGLKLGFIGNFIFLGALYFTFEFIKKKRQEKKHRNKTSEKNHINKNFLLKYKSKIFTITLLLLISGMAFYWYEYRPSQIRKNCYESLKGKSFYSSSAADIAMKACLMKNGLE